jgi:hypothetical protein
MWTGSFILKKTTSCESSSKDTPDSRVVIVRSTVAVAGRRRCACGNNRSGSTGSSRDAGGQGETGQVKLPEGVKVRIEK